MNEAVFATTGQREIIKCTEVKAAAEILQQLGGRSTADGTGAVAQTGSEWHFQPLNSQSAQITLDVRQIKKRCY